MSVPGTFGPVVEPKSAVRDWPERGVNGPTTDADLKQSNVHFREKQTFSQPAQKRFGK